MQQRKSSQIFEYRIFIHLFVPISILQHVKNVKIWKIHTRFFLSLSKIIIACVPLHRCQYARLCIASLDTTLILSLWRFHTFSSHTKTAHISIHYQNDHFKDTFMQNHCMLISIENVREYEKKLTFIHWVCMAKGIAVRSHHECIFNWNSVGIFLFHIITCLCCVCIC